MESRICEPSVCFEPAYVETLPNLDPVLQVLASAGYKVPFKVDNEHPAYRESHFEGIGETLKACASMSPDRPGPSAVVKTQPTNSIQCSIDPAHLQSKSLRRRRPKRHAVLRIASQLQDLQDENPDRIVVVRKINRLGYDSAPILKKHFECFGPIEDVRLSNAHEKPPGNSTHMRVRPSGFAFVLFQHALDAEKALAIGDSHMIDDVEVFVRGFQRRQEEEGDGLLDEDADERESMGSTVNR